MEIINLLAIVFVAIALFFIVSILYRKNKKLEVIIDDAKKKILIYQTRLNEIKKKQNKMEELDKLARDFFNEKDNLGHNLTYLEIAKIFEKNHELKKAEFCKRMSAVIYSKPINFELESDNLIKLFSGILMNNLVI